MLVFFLPTVSLVEFTTAKKEDVKNFFDLITIAKR